MEDRLLRTIFTWLNHLLLGDHHLVPVGGQGGGGKVPPAINKTQQTKYKTQGTFPITSGLQQTQFPRVDCFCGFKHFARTREY
ncbi:hypothetical protein CEXT_796791 [Caerostris extrusa]|uniref:Secreted protein n=1 Tax=Caerostris extrusa TaxID=172846 RepID=A0AAV4XB07_CAEEX|nr:hypothetical protein CEXT_796791 [Caerostris extrusa]